MVSGWPKIGIHPRLVDRFSQSLPVVGATLVVAPLRAPRAPGRIVKRVMRGSSPGSRRPLGQPVGQPATGATTRVAPICVRLGRGTPSPLVGEGRGGGSCRGAQESKTGSTPTPGPSPQGGGEEFAASSSLNLTPMRVAPTSSLRRHESTLSRACGAPALDPCLHTSMTTFPFSTAVGYVLIGIMQGGSTTSPVRMLNWPL